MGTPRAKDWTLQEAITSTHRATLLRPEAEAEWPSLFGALQQNPALMQGVKVELQRLESYKHARHSQEPFAGDHEAKIRHAALVRMLERFAEQEKSDAAR